MCYFIYFFTTFPPAEPDLCGAIATQRQSSTSVRPAVRLALQPRYMSPSYLYASGGAAPQLRHLGQIGLVTVKAFVRCDNPQTYS
jgi:hypothetical protein